MNKVFLALVMLFSGVWRAMGADIVQLKAILTVKLKMDDRKPLSFGRRKEGKARKFSSVLNMFIYFCMGLIYMFPLLYLQDTIFGLTMYFTMFLFILTFSLITDFSNVLIDSTDKFILIPKPISDQTLFLSRNLYVFIYLFRVVLPMSLPGWIVLGIDKGWPSAVLFPLPLVLMVFIALFLVNGIYLLILRLASAERFKNIISSFQIAFTIFVVAFYYLMQGITKSQAFIQADIKDYGWVRLTPPYWLAACWSWLGFKTELPGTMLLSILAIVFPLASLWITLKWFAPTFGQKIAAIDGVEIHEHTTVKNDKKIKSTLAQKMSAITNSNPLSKAGFMLTWLQTSRSRSFKMRVYPSFAYVPVYFFYLLLMDDKPFGDVWRELPQSHSFYILLYMSAFAMMQAMNYVNISEQYKAAWIYYSAPVETPGNLLTGSFKALWIKFFLPFITIIGVFVVYVWGPHAIIDVLLAAVNVTVFTACTARLNQRTLPFSVKEQMKSTGMKTFTRVLSSFLLIGILGFSHYLASVFWWLEVLFIILSAIFLWLVWDSLKNTSWKNIYIAEA